MSTTQALLEPGEGRSKAWKHEAGNATHSAWLASRKLCAINQRNTFEKTELSE